jgi:hypothetical protein
MGRQSVIFAARIEWQEDNRQMTEDRDLLPWILGALSMAAVAMAIAVALTGRSAPAHASGQMTSSASTLATAELNPKMQNGAAPAGSASAPGAPAPGAWASTASASAAWSSAAQAFPALPSAQVVGTAQTQPAPSPNPSGSQIWECTTNGVKTFSNNRCGNAAVLREVGPINVMDASPASNVHWYGAGPNDAPDYYDPSPQQPADNSYPAVVGVPYLERRRPERPQQATHHDRGHPRRN